jgi:hypothetical protein
MHNHINLFSLSKQSYAQVVATNLKQGGCTIYPCHVEVLLLTQLT